MADLAVVVSAPEQISELFEHALNDAIPYTDIGGVHCHRHEYGFSSHALSREAINRLEEAILLSLGKLYPRKGDAAKATDKVMRQVKVRILIAEDSTPTLTTQCVWRWCRRTIERGDGHGRP